MHLDPTTGAQNAASARHGFTTLELMVAMVATAVLVLTAGTVLWFGAATWRRGTVAVDVRRDAAFVMQLVAHATRGNSLTNISIRTGSLTIPPVQFLQSSDGLTYTPNIASPGNNIAAIKCGVDLFQSAITNGALSVHLRMKGNNVLCDLQATYKCRN